MKKTFIFGLMAATLVFTPCSEDDLNGNNGASNSNQKGMVLRATVEQPGDTRATFTDSEEVAGAWDFAFATGDKVSVTNMDMNPDFYTFTNEGTEFKCADAKAAEGPVTWFAYFPSNEVSLVGQSGTKEDVANLYALAGKSSATTGEEGLEIEMSPKVAILVINNQIGTIDINVKNGASTWVKGLSANDNGFNVTTSTTQQNLLSVTSTGTYYIAVPAGVQLAVKDGDKTIKSTGTNGLQAGKYYNLTLIGYGTAKATISGAETDVNWVQLWENGPKFSERHMTKKRQFTVAIKTGADFPWGANWRTPSKDEMEELLLAGTETGSEKVTCKYGKVNDAYGFTFRGVGDYAGNSVFFPVDNPEVCDNTFGSATYWSSTSYDSFNGFFMNLTYSWAGLSFEWSSGSTNITKLVRPVLAE